MPTVTAFAKQNRAAGVWSSDEVATNPATMTNRTFTATATGLTNAFLTNAANALSLSLMGGYNRPDGGIDWRELTRSNWTGAQRDRNGNAVVPFLVYTTTNDLPDLARLDMTLGQTTNCGVDLTAS